MFPLNAYPGTPKAPEETDQYVLQSRSVGTLRGLHSPSSVRSCFVHSAAPTTSPQHCLCPPNAQLQHLENTYVPPPPSKPCHLAVRLNMYSLNSQNPQTTGTSPSSRTPRKQQSSPAGAGFSLPFAASRPGARMHHHWPRWLTVPTLKVATAREWECALGTACHLHRQAGIFAAIALKALSRSFSSW